MRRQSVKTQMIHARIEPKLKRSAERIFSEDVESGKQGKDLDRLEVIVNLLQEEERLPARCRPHPLRGDWRGHWDCHVEPDWILIYRIIDDELRLERTGTHADLF